MVAGVGHKRVRNLIATKNGETIIPISTASTNPNSSTRLKNFICQ
jgi:hypothetical protein